MKKIIASAIVILFCSNYTAAQTTASESNPSGENKKQMKVIPFPVIAYSGTTSLMLGAMLFLRFEDDLNPEARNDSISVLGMYTLKEQMQGKLNYDKYLADDSILIRGKNELVRFPTEFYGIGSSNSQESMEEYDSVYVSLRHDLIYRITDKGLPEMRVGPVYMFRNVTYSDIKKGGLLDNGAVPGIDGTRVSSPGVEFIYDARDNSTWSTRGNYFETSALFNAEALGATQNCQTFIADYRHFWDLADIISSMDKRSYIAGVHGFYKAQGGEVPLALMSGLGGDVILRGYGSRYQDKCKYAAESELRYPIWKWLSGTVFGGFGDVAEKPAGFDWKDTHYAAGLGLRFALMEGLDKINLRLDIAYTREGDIDGAFDVMEAF